MFCGKFDIFNLFYIFHSAFFILAIMINHKDYCKTSSSKVFRLNRDSRKTMSIVTFRTTGIFLWFGTQDDLYKYDGYSFVMYRNDLNDYDSMSHNYISSIMQDRRGGLWIGTDGSGVNKLCG
jgi:ligand-binding sensor domain-containing protein